MRTAEARRIRNDRGVALLAVLLVGFAFSAIALASAMWMLNAQVIQKNGDRSAILHDVAVAALEEGRSRLNVDPAQYPVSSYATLVDNSPVQDATGAVLPGVRQTIYAGPDGITSGQYGMYGTVIARVGDDFGNVVVRRLRVNQESFARYAYFTTIEGNIVFANNDQIRGPVHSNDVIKIDNSGATFFDQVTTAASSIQGEGSATFAGPPPRKSVPPIPLPTVQAFASLQVRAQNAGMSFVGNNSGNSPGEASLRMEFVALDLNADNDSTDADEGFVRIYQDNARPWYVTAQLSGIPFAAGDIRRSPNCGSPVLPNPGGPGNVVVIGVPPVNSTADFRTAADTNPDGTRNTAASRLLDTSNANWRCYLGGDPRLAQQVWTWPSASTDAAAWAVVQGNWAGGAAGWVPRPAGIGAPTGNAAFAQRADNTFLWPLSRIYNPAWEGVIYVNGRVAISGVLSGRVTLASPRNIIIGDDVRMAVDPGDPLAAECGNILGLFSGDSVMVADNTINTPQRINGAGNWRTYDDTREENIHAVVLALDIFSAERYNSGPNAAQACDGINSGRGCLSLTGGIIQRSRGAVGLTSGEGYIKRYTYNACAASDPPPYFPTTGRFSKNRVYELDPRGFDVAKWFEENQNN